MMRVSHSYATEDERWQAIVRRDKRADGMFCYVVRTTGVYSRPSCVARTPRRENVRFFSTVDEAERAGYRSCRRCRPDEPDLGKHHAAAVRKACVEIDSCAEPPSLDKLSAVAGFSRFHFHRIFKAVTGVTPHAYITARRARRVRRELSTSDTVTDAIYRSGFHSSGRFYAETPDMLGMTPTSFRNGGSGTSIRFSIGHNTLGSVLIAAADKGVCAVLVGDHAAALVRRLKALFPRARLVDPDPEFDELVAEALDRAEPPAIGRKLPPDIQGIALDVGVRQILRERGYEAAA
jgi:AraC family transcriptional regulator of adaptative response/methylated-DNA-[protein]-cysteine methyltransferase